MTSILEAAKILGRHVAGDEANYLTADESDVAGCIVQTGDTVADFIAAQGEPTRRTADEETGSVVLEWAASKSAGRPKYLYVVDMGGFRASVLD